MSKPTSSRLVVRLLSLAAVAVLGTCAVGCDGCGADESGPAPAPDTKKEKPPEPEPSVDMEKATSEAETAGIDQAVRVTDQSRYLAGKFEGGETPEQTEPTEPAPSAQRRQPAKGNIDRQALVDAFETYAPEAQDCYERALKQDPSLAGRVTLNLIIDTDGTVARANAIGESLLSEKVNNCLEGLAQEWTFPQPEGGPAEVNKPFTFSPKD